MRYVTCRMRYVTCTMRYVTYRMRYVTYRMRYVTYSHVLRMNRSLHQCTEVITSVNWKIVYHIRMCSMMCTNESRGVRVQIVEGPYAVHMGLFTWARGVFKVYFMCIYICMHYVHWQTNWSRLTYEWVTWSSWNNTKRPIDPWLIKVAMSHDTYMNVSHYIGVSRATYEWVMPLLNESCHIWMSHVTYEYE